MGQITVDTQFGNLLKEICRVEPNIKTVVEIGTWDGMGSTQCIILGLQQSEKTNIQFLSLETNKKMYDAACAAWKDTLPSWASFIHGRVVDVHEMDSVELSDAEQEWFKEDVQAIMSCPNVFNLMPAKIDMLLLDGGEFTTKNEFLKLVDRCNIIFADDTNIRKCKWIREHVLCNPDKYHLIFDAPQNRNGVMAFSVVH